MAIEIFKTHALFKCDQKTRTGCETVTVWKKIANFDLFQFFTWEEPIEEHFHTDRRKQEEIISKELSEGKL